MKGPYVLDIPMMYITDLCGDDYEGYTLYLEAWLYDWELVETQNSTARTMLHRHRVRVRRIGNQYMAFKPGKPFDVYVSISRQPDRDMGIWTTSPRARAIERLLTLFEVTIVRHMSVDEQPVYKSDEAKETKIEYTTLAFILNLRMRAVTSKLSAFELDTKALSIYVIITKYNLKNDVTFNVDLALIHFSRT